MSCTTDVNHINFHVAVRLHRYMDIKDRSEAVEGPHTPAHHQDNTESLVNRSSSATVIQMRLLDVPGFWQSRDSRCVVRPAFYYGATMESFQATIRRRRTYFSVSTFGLVPPHVLSDVLFCTSSYSALLRYQTALIRTRAGRCRGRFWHTKPK